MYRASVPVQRCTLIYLYLYSPYGPYGLYRASVPVQYSYTSTPPMGRKACTEPQCLYNCALYLYLHLYSPYGPYSLYRASVPVQRGTLPLQLNLVLVRIIGRHKRLNDTGS